MRRLLARLLFQRGNNNGGGDDRSEGRSDDESNYLESIKPMVIATNMQLPIYNNDLLKKDSTTRFYCTNSMSCTENLHTYAAIIDNEIYYFQSDYMVGVSNSKQILCCKLSSSLKDMATDTELFNTTYTCKNDVKEENNALFRALCTDEENHLIYIYGGSILTFQRMTPTNYFHMFDAKTKEFSRIEMKDAEKLPRLDGHTLIRRDTHTFYTFGGLLGRAYCNKIFEFNIKTGEWREVIANNQDQIKPRSYHVGQYVKKHDVMVIVSGKLKVGQSPMTNEILIYHFKENRFQIISDSPNPFHKIPACHLIHSCNLSANQFAFYGGCKTTDLNNDQDYDPNLYVFTFNNRVDKKSTDLTPVISMFYLQERTASCYTTVIYHKKFKCFVLLGANPGQRKDMLNFFYLDTVSYNNPIETLENIISIMDWEHHSRLKDVTIHCTH